MASISIDVDIADDEEPYGTARAVDSDDDRPVVTRNRAHQTLVS